MDKVNADYRKHVSDGIQTGEALGLIDDLSPLQRQLYEADDFHFANGVLLKKIDPTLEAGPGLDRLEADDEVRIEFATRILERLEATGERLGKEIWNGENSTLGLWIEWDDKLEEEKRLEICSREASRRQQEALVSIMTCMKEKYSEAQLSELACQEEVAALIAADSYAGKPLKEITQFLMDQRAFEGSDALDHLVEIGEDCNGIVMEFDNGAKITVDLVSLNSMFGGDGYAPPRDSYRTVRLLQYEEETPEQISAQNRKTHFAIIISQIDELHTMGEFNTHWFKTISTKNPNSLYSQDKDWRQEWGDHMREAEATRIVNKLTITRPPQIIEHNDLIYTLVLDNTEYQARVPEGEAINVDMWFDTTHFIKVPTSIAQKLVHMACSEDILPDNGKWVNNIPAGEPPRPADEETLRRRVERQLKAFDRARMKATTYLNLTNVQWKAVFEAYDEKRKTLAEENIKTLINTNATPHISGLIEHAKTLDELRNIVKGPLSEASQGELLINNVTYILPASSMANIRPLIANKVKELQNV